MADSAWEDLAMNLLDLIFSKLESCVDYVHFSLVCKSWHSNAVEGFTKRKFNNNPAPLLLLPTKIGEEGSEWGLYNILGEKFLGSKLQIPDYVAGFRASSEGWSATIGKNLSVTLHNPFVPEKDSVIHLPPLPICEISEISPIPIQNIFTFTPKPLEDPTDLRCVLILEVFQGCIVYIRPRKDTGWKTAKEWEYDVMSSENRIRPMIYDSGMFFGLVCVPEPAYIFLTEEAEVSVFNRYFFKSLDGELLQVQKIHSRSNLSFTLYKFCSETDSWIEKDSLGDSALFIGSDNSSLLVSASGLGKCKRNHIYFTRAEESYHIREVFEFCEYDLETGSVTFGNVVPKVFSPTMCLPAPVWVLPTVRF